MCIIDCTELFIVFLVHSFHDDSQRSFNASTINSNTGEHNESKLPSQISWVCLFVVSVTICDWWEFCLGVLACVFRSEISFIMKRGLFVRIKLKNLACHSENPRIVCLFVLKAIKLLNCKHYGQAMHRFIMLLAPIKLSFLRLFACLLLIGRGF